MGNHKKPSMLILACGGLNGEQEEVKNIEVQAKLYSISARVKTIKTYSQLVRELKRNEAYDYIYLSAHGDETGFANEQNTMDIKWHHFGELLRNHDCLNEESHLLLSCCRGGLREVAYDLIHICPNISYVVGPRIELYPQEVLIGFNIYLFNVAYLQIDPIVTTEKLKAGTDLRFICYDSLEVKTEPAYLMRREKYRLDFVDLDQDGIKDEVIVTKIIEEEQQYIYSDKDAYNHLKE